MRLDRKFGIDFGKLGNVIPVVTQDVNTKEVLMVAFMNEAAWTLTIETGKMWYYSRKRNKLWMKGEESGHVQKIVDLYLDCDNDTLLAVVEQVGGACDLGYHSCFDKHWKDDHFETLAAKVFDPPSVYSYSKCLRIALPTASLSTCTNQLIKMAFNPLTPEKDNVLKSILPSCGVPIMFSSHDSRDIPALVATGAVDAGITGFDFVVEKQQRVVPIHLFGYNKRGRGPAIWAVAVPEAWTTTTPHELEGKQIVTEVPNLTALFFNRNNIQANIIPRIGDREQLFRGHAIVELIETGTTLQRFSYRPLCLVLETYTAIVANPESYGYSWKRRWIEELVELLSNAEMSLPLSDKRIIRFNDSVNRGIQVATSWESFRVNWFTGFREQQDK